jgi:hypothetical protein
MVCACIPNSATLLPSALSFLRQPKRHFAVHTLKRCQLCSHRFSGVHIVSLGMGRPFPHVQAWGRHCADNNAGAQRYLFSGRSDIWRSRHSASPGGGTHVQKLGTLVSVAIRSREDHSDEKITHHEVGWSPLRTHPINVRGGRVSDWEESQMLAALSR